jgi:hypothetical protein
MSTGFRSALVTSAIALPIALAAQTQPATSKATLSGTVINAVTKQPVRRADVTLMPATTQMAVVYSAPGGPPGQRQTTTDADGKFTFTDVEGGRYTLRAQRQGLMPGMYGARLNLAKPPRFAMGSTITVADGAEMTDLRIEMIPSAIVAGRVVDDEGEPIEGVMVQLLNSIYMNGQRAWRPTAGGAPTNDRGEFRITNVPPGEALLMITRWNRPPVKREVDGVMMADVPTYYPGVADIGQAAKLNVTPGAELSGFDLRFAQAKVVKVSGSLLDESGKPPAQVHAFLQGKSGSFGPPVAQVLLKADGQFEIDGLPAGEYWLLVNANNRVRQPQRFALSVGDQDVKDLAFRLQPTVSIPVDVVMKQGVEGDVGQVQVSLVDDESGQMWMPPVSGKAALEGVMPGRYRVQVMIPNLEMYVDSMTYADRAVIGKKIDVAASGPPLRITLDTGAPTVLGTVKKDGQPAGGIRISVLDPRDRTTARGAVSEPDGSFQLLNVPPGDYIAFAVEDGESWALQDREVFEKYASKGTKVTITKNSAPKLELTAFVIED